MNSNTEKMVFSISVLVRKKGAKGALFDIF